MKKNADMPAMPQVVTEDIRGTGLVGSHMEEEWQGLTKREMFAMNAPECPDWFKEMFMSRPGTVTVYNPKTGHSDKLSLDDRQKLYFEWRYAYADLMLEDK